MINIENREAIFVKHSKVFYDANEYGTRVLTRFTYEKAFQEYADQQTKPLIDEIAELKLDNSNLEARVRSWGKMYKTLLQENLKLKSRIDELQREIDINKNPF